MCVCVCVCVSLSLCLSVSERETDRQTDRQTETERVREREIQILIGKHTNILSLHNPILLKQMNNNYKIIYCFYINLFTYRTVVL